MFELGNRALQDLVKISGSRDALSELSGRAFGGNAEARELIHDLESQPIELEPERVVLNRNITFLRKILMSGLKPFLVLKTLLSDSSGGVPLSSWDSESQTRFNQGQMIKPDGHHPEHPNV